MSLVSQMVQSIESTPHNVVHAVGASSMAAGGAGAALATYADTAQHLTVIVGFAAACVGIIGTTFYAVYWAIKTLSAIRAVRKGEEVK